MPPHISLLSSPNDEYDEGGITQLDPLLILRKRNNQGRLRKWMGDLCLQVGSPGDAFDHYTAAVTELKSINDILWLASAIEGYITCILLLVNRLGASPDDLLGTNYGSNSNFKQQGQLQSSSVFMTPEEKVISAAEEKAQEALSLYSRCTSCALFEVECCMRLVRLLARSNYLDKEQRVMEGISRAASMTGVTIQQQAEVTREGALICKSLGMKRKAAFLLYVATLQLSEPDHSDATQLANLSQALLHATSLQYGIGRVPWASLPSHSLTASPLVDGAPSSTVEVTRSGRIPDGHREILPVASERQYALTVQDPSLGWTSVRRVLLTQLAQVSRDAGDLQSSSG